MIQIISQSPVKAGGHAKRMQIVEKTRDGKKLSSKTRHLRLTNPKEGRYVDGSDGRIAFCVKDRELHRAA